MSGGVETVRVFFALLLDEELRREVDDRIRPLRSGGEPVRWVAAANLHVTIRFLGDVTPGLRGRVEERAARVAAEFPPFRFALGASGAFPSLSSPRVLWVGVSEGGAEITGLARRLDDAIRDLGFEKEARFHPHITTGRTKRRPSPRMLERYGALPVEPIAERAAALHLMGSTLTPRGAVYRVLREFPLGTALPAHAPE
ncbi:MAG: RNA 2',3'-cyclic phosphodiesterase [Candidatus Eisenbacteria bacterium]|nr:RNA 2',3'-cyclic phosphodiesterase [Candidatus Eisenbacteria bacterium]